MSQTSSENPVRRKRNSRISQNDDRENENASTSSENPVRRKRNSRISQDDDRENEEATTTYTKNEKILIIEKCMKYADKLYEKFSHKVNRKTQSNAWNEVATELKNEGISITDTFKLKQNVSNWVQRATKANDEAKKTGVGKQKKLDPFQSLCLDFVRAAKGDTAVDYVTNQEASGSSAVNLDKDLELPTTKKKTAEQWKEKYFASMVSSEEKSSEAGIKKAHLKSYHTLLKCIKMEKEMGLKDYEIEYMRSTVSNDLLEYPTHLSSFVVENIE